MSDECHESTCPRLSYTATTCQCGFTQRLIQGKVDVASVNRGQGGCKRYSAMENPFWDKKKND